MKSLNPVILAALLLANLLLPGFVSANCDTIESLDWMLGNWVAADDKTATTETWVQAGQRSFEGRGIVESLTSEKIISSEALLLAEMSGELFFVAKVASNNMPVPFKLVECEEKLAVFENTSHDFPKSLSYRRTDASHMRVLVRGEGQQGFEIEYTLQDDH